jgi:hypothetical protein
MAQFLVNIDGREVEVDAKDVDEAEQLAFKKLPLAHRLERGRRAAATGFRNAVEGILGFPGDIPSLAGGLTKWGLEKLPDDWVTSKRAAEVGQEIESGMGAVNPFYTSQDFHGAASKILPKSIEESTTQEPITLGERGAQLSSELITGLAGGEANAAKRGIKLGIGEAAKETGKRLATRVVAPAGGILATQEGTDALVKAGKMSRETAALLQTIAGAASGVAVHGAANAQAGFSARRAAARQINSTPSAVKEIYDALIADNHTPETARAEMTKLGVDATVMDLGPNAQQTGIKVATRPGPGRTAIHSSLTAREEAAGERAHQARGEAFGPPVDRDLTLEALKARRDEIGPKYDAAKRNQQRPADLQGMADDIDAELGTARGSTAASLRRLRKHLNLPGTKELDPSSEGLHAIRQELDTAIAAAPPGSPLQAKLSRYREQLSGELKDVSPDIAELDKQYSQTHKEEEAFNQGQVELAKGAEAKSPGEFDRVFQQMSPGEQEHLVAGANRYVASKLGLSDRERQQLKTLFGGDWNEAKLRTMVGNDKADAFMQAMKREDTYRNTYGRVVQNSRTAEALDQGGKPGVLEGAAEAFTAGTVGSTSPKVGGLMAAGKVVKNLFDKTKGMSDKTRAEVGKLLVTDRPDDLFRALEIMHRTGKVPLLPPAMVAALLARQEELGNR